MMGQAFRQGIFKEELKNRFLCLVKVDGEDTLCYIPSSCRLSNFIDLAGRTVLLLPITSAHSRTKYSVYALSTNNGYVLLNLSKANAVIKDNISSRRFSVLGKRNHIKKEFCVNGYKSDLYIEDTNTVVEIKSILSFEKGKTARFPSVYSQRALDQLKKICSLLDSGYKVCYVFVSLNPITTSLVINEEIQEYRTEFVKCIQKGMIVLGLSIKLTEGEPTICSTITVNV